MVKTLQLYRESPYPPENGAERRVWESGKKFAEFGETWVAAPWEGVVPPENTINTLDIGTVWLNSKASRIYLWTLLIAGGVDMLNKILTRKSLHRVKSRNIEPDLVVSECPQLSPAALAIAREFNSPFLINKQNAEFRVVEQFLAGRQIPKPICSRIVNNHRAFEQCMIDQSDAVVFMSDEDCEPFNLSSSIYTVIPNGTNYSEFGTDNGSSEPPNNPELDSSMLSCIFVGSYDYDPNKDAAKRIIQQIAPSCPEIQFLLVGRNPPSTDQPNVLTPGFVDDLGKWLTYADIGLCPLRMGSGTKLKMLDYMAAGLPIVTTPVGVQGLKIIDREMALIRESTTEIIEAIKQLAASEELRNRLGENAQQLGKQYDWSNLLKEYDSLIDQIV